MIWWEEAKANPMTMNAIETKLIEVENATATQVVMENAIARSKL